MFFYSILPNKYLPIEFLTYSYSERLLPGQLVFIPIGSKKYVGVVLEEVDFSKVNIDIEKIKSISEIIPFSLLPHHISFLFSFSYNTFNRPGEVLDFMVRTIIDLPKATLKTLTENYQSKLEKKLDDASQKSTAIDQPIDEKPIVEALLDIEITLRIIYIIRTNILNKMKNLIEFNQKGNFVFLIIVPENKVLDDIYEKWVEIEADFISELKKLADDTILQSDFKHLENILKVYTFSAKSGVKTRRGFLHDSLFDLLPTFSIVIGTRSALFLPYPHLNNIYLIDEANNLHIQDQNSVYFDTRDAVFLLSQSYKTSLTFLSTLPSIRLQHFYSEAVLEQYMNNVLLKDKNLPEVRYFERAVKDDNFDSILGIIHDNVLDTHFSLEDSQE